MGKEFASAVARWCHLDDNGPVPVISAICNQRNISDQEWFKEYFSTIKLVTNDYRELITSDNIDAVYCAVPHDLHRQIYCDIISANKHLLGEKPFGMDADANAAILDTLDAYPHLIVRCTSQFPYYPAAAKLIQWIGAQKYGRLMEVKCGFHHASDMDLNKPINWKRRAATNGEYGCMGDLGLHTQHIPLRMGWVPYSLFADLQNIVTSRFDEDGKSVACDTWDNAVITGQCKDPDGNDFSLILEMKRMAPGQTNTWFIEVYGSEGSIRFSTSNPKALYQLETTGIDQGWTRTDIGSQSFIPSIASRIFESGSSDAFQQMLGAFMHEFKEEGTSHPFGNVTPEETRLSHRILTAALKSQRSGKRIYL
jgi:predicted dehydrogenase